MKVLNIENLIGMQNTDKEVIDYISELNETPIEDCFADMRIFVYPSQGIEMYVDKNHSIISILLYAFADDEHGRYDGVLPHLLTFEDDNFEVVKKLGNPALSGVEKNTGANFERFDFERYSIHVQYAENCLSISVVSLMLPVLPQRKRT